MIEVTDTIELCEIKWRSDKTHDAYEYISYRDKEDEFESLIKEHFNGKLCTPGLIDEYLYKNEDSIMEKLGIAGNDPQDIDWSSRPYFKEVQEAGKEKDFYDSWCKYTKDYRLIGEDEYFDFESILLSKIFEDIKLPKELYINRQCW